MNSRILTGKLMHARNDGKRHGFNYDLNMLWLDLDELNELQQTSRWFGYNRRAVLSIHDRDYLGDDPAPIREKLARLLRERGIEPPDGRVMLLTCARYLNYVFNPVSFYYAYDRNDALRCVVAEVNNTFSEKHLYVLDDRRRIGSADGARFASPKDFHVSPFLDLAGRYDFLFRFPADGLEITIDTEKRGQKTFRARLEGQFTPLSRDGLKRMLWQHPLMGWITFPRILSQAIRLVFKRAPIHERPTPVSTDTIGRRPQASRPPFAARMVFRAMERFTTGRLDLHLPDGTSRSFGDAAAPGISVQVRDWRFFGRVIRNGDIGLGESYMNGDWTTDDLTGFMRLLIENREAVTHVDDGRPISRLTHRILSWLKRNTPHGSRRNIAYHYDLSNELYQLMLDSTMTYSSAYFEHPGQSLEDAQNAKYRRLCEKVGLRDGDHVLEIGCGWGGFASFAARYANCRITGITISRQQYDYAKARMEREGLADRVEIRMEDYRTMTGRYDRIVSIEMLEAVGYAYFGAYFAALERLLKKNGSVAIQVISIPDQAFDEYRKTYDWIRKYIFPGGLLPSIESLVAAARRHSKLVLQDTENIAEHYVDTLRQWRERFDENIEKIRDLGFDIRFERMWRFYLCYCEAAFASRYLGDLQMVWTRSDTE